MGKEKFKILFLSRANSQDNSAYSHRLKMLKKGLEELGVETGIFYLGDRRITSHTMFPIYFPLLVPVLRKYDFIHAGGMPSAFVANLSRLFHRRKVIYDIHGDRIREISEERKLGGSNQKLGHLPVIKAFIQGIIAVWFSDYYLSVSRPLKKLFQSRGVAGERIFIIRNGVDLKKFSPPKNYHANRNFIFTYAGRFQSYQAIDDFVKAAKAINYSNVRFRIIGFTRNDNDRKIKICNMLGERTELIDSVSQDELVQLLQSSDVLVIPRRLSHVTTVAFPTKFAEYIALGKPVIVSDVDETADLVSKYGCGEIYKNGADGLKKSMLKMLHSSKVELKRMGINSRRLAENMFDWQIICKQYYHILLKISRLSPRN